MAKTKYSVLSDDVHGHQAALDEAVREMCSYEVLNGRYLVQMPVMTAVGSLVSVSVWPEGNGETFMVSDDGSAYQEISAACASERTFTTVAKAHCIRHGAEFDGATMLFMRVGKDRLRGAISSMASLIKEVVDETIEKSFAAKVNSSRERFVRRATEAFSGAKITEGALIVGSSTAEYHVDLLVEADGRDLAFEHFSKHHVAVNSAYATLSDIARLEGGPRPIGVTPNLQAIGPKLSLISSVAQIIPTKSSVDTYRTLLAA